MGFFELDGVNFGRGVHHEIDTGAVLGEGNDIADIVGIFEDHEDAV